MSATECANKPIDHFNDHEADIKEDNSCDKCSAEVRCGMPVRVVGPVVMCIV